MIKYAKAYWDSIGGRDKRAIVFGIVAGGMIVIYLFIGLPLFEDWSRVRDELEMYRTRLDSVNGQSSGSKAKIVGLCQAVPFMESPLEEDAQRKLFWDKTYDQLKSAGIKLSSGPGYVSSSKKKKAHGMRALRLKFAGSCKYDQLVKFLARLNENPYLVSIEELTINGDEKKPGQVNIDVTVETFVQ